MIGTLQGSGGGRSLHLSGHVDVVPIDAPGDWTYEPWGGTVADGRIWGRGAGDMKGGLAAYVIAAEALAETHGDRRGDLLFSSVFEEECGGNGMWSITRAGHVADATLLGEPTGLKLSHGGTGVVWARLAARGAAGHAFLGRRSGSFDLLSQAVAALRQVEEEANTPPRDPVFAAVSDWPFSMSVGRIAGGVWTASLPAELVAYVRFGFGRDTSPQEMQDRIRTAVGEAAPEVDVTFEAFRAHAYCHDDDRPVSRSGCGRAHAGHRHARGVHGLHRHDRRALRRGAVPLLRGGRGELPRRRRVGRHRLARADRRRRCARRRRLVTLTGMSDATVCLSIDFDATSSWFMLGTTGARNLSRGEFGPATGAPRLLDLCTRCGIPSTWYVPGHTADNYPEIVARIAEEGHEVANHGYIHEDFSVLSIDEGRRAIQKGNEALERVSGQRPRGIRLSGGDFDGALLEVVAEEGFTYDSSLFGEYYAQWCRAKDTLGEDGKITLGRRLDLVELPITFVTSDVVHFEISIQPELPARLPNPRDVEQVWRDQFDYMCDRLDGAYFMLMVHPESIGWGSRMLMLERFVEYCQSKPRTRFAKAEAIADEFRHSEAARDRRGSRRPRRWSTSTSAKQACASLESASGR